LKKKKRVRGQQGVFLCGNFVNFQASKVGAVSSTRGEQEVERSPMKNGKYEDIRKIVAVEM